MTNEIPDNVTSYDTGNLPFKHDVGRGKWSSKWDFYAASLSHCFGFRHFVLYFIFIRTNAIILLVAYLLGMITFILPLYFTQMFLGQFTSTGTISAFRIAPLFKGIGYASVILNIFTSSYFMVAAAFPLYIIFESLQPYLPWDHCSNYFNTETCYIMRPGMFNKTSDYDIYDWLGNKTFPIHEYLEYLFNQQEDEPNEWYLSWRLILCTFAVWIIVGLLLFKGVEMLGKVFRYTTVIMLCCFLLITLRILCVEETWEVLEKFFVIKFSSFNNIEYLLASPLLTASAFGAGWGNVLTIASYNNFNEDIGKMSFVTCFTQMIVFIIATVNYAAVDNFLKTHYAYSYLQYIHHDTLEYIFVSYAFYFTHLSWPHFWTIIFFLALFISQISEGVLQILSILTAIFDEYEYTRIYKNEILIGFISFFALISIFFCTFTGFSSIFGLYSASGANKLLIILIELIIITWIYGRQRFQRDVKFMTDKIMHSWKIWMMRFLTPILILFAMILYIFQSIMHLMYGYVIIFFSFILLKVFPILFIPGYMVYKIYTSTGSILDRFKNLCRPNDWYPADPIVHRNYENYLGNSEMTNELVHVHMETETVQF